MPTHDETQRPGDGFLKGLDLLTLELHDPPALLADQVVVMAPVIHSLVTGLRVVEVRPEENLLLVAGAVPGPPKGYVYIRPSVRG